MSVEQSIERISQGHEAVMWWEPDERAIVFAGSDVAEAAVITDYTSESVDILEPLTLDGYYRKRLDTMDQQRSEPITDPSFVEPSMIALWAGNIVTVTYFTSTLEWLAKNDDWPDFALNAIRLVRADIFNNLSDNSDEYVDEGSAVWYREVDDTPEGVSLHIPEMVVNSLGCSCLGPDPDDASWESISLYGQIELNQHNVDSHMDSFPLAAGLAAINSKILGVESSQ